MTRRRRRVAVLIIASISAGAPAAAQTEGTLGIDATYVEYEGFLASGALVFSPAIRFDSPRLSLAGQASWTRFESGRSVIQAGGGAAWLTSLRGPWYLELSGSTGVSRYANVQTAGHFLGGSRLHVSRGSVGGWLGAATGASEGNGVPVELSAAAWSVRNHLALVATATGSWQGPVHHADVLGAIRWSGATLQLEARGGVRPWATTTGGGKREAYGELSARLQVNRWLAASLSGGKSPTDPVRRTLGTTYVSGGFVLRAFGRNGPTVPFLAEGALGGRSVPTESAGPILEVLGSDGPRRIRIHAPNATTLELMGDFTDWNPVQLTRTGGVWEIALDIPPGVHRMNIRVNGGPWSVPGGVRVEHTDFGGTVGLIVIP